MLLAGLLALHGLLHLLGFVKAFGLMALPGLARPVSRVAGLGWLAAAALLLATAAARLAGADGWWALGAVALLASQALIASAWQDARAGTLVNLVLLVAVGHGFLSRGPFSFRAAFDREVAAGLQRRAPQPLVSEADLAGLPPPVQRYLRLAGVVGQPRVQAMRARFAGSLRGGPAEPWMAATVEQVSFFDEPARLFLVEASRAGVPFEAFHRYVGPSATFQVKVASLVTVAAASGPEMDRSETVTFLNDMAALAPATLLSPAVRWEAVDDRTARATYTQGAQTVRAELAFDEAGWLVGFWSDDRRMASPDGRSFEAARWSTPLHDHRAYGPVRLASRGEARWRLPAGEFEYARFELVGLEYAPAR